MSDRQEIDNLQQLMPSVPNSADDALAIFDAAEPIEPGFMIGTWCGAEVPTGHPLDGMLGASGWWGKQFIDFETVHPLLFRNSSGTGVWSLNPGLAPLGLALKVKLPAAAAPLLRPAIRTLRPVVQTRRAKARLRTTVYRGRSTAAMVYDQQPIIDVFRKMEGGAVIGAMDLRDSPQPYFFVLQRVDSTMS